MTNSPSPTPSPPLVLPHQRPTRAAVAAAAHAELVHVGTTVPNHTSRVRVLDIRAAPVTTETPLAEWFSGYGSYYQDDPYWAYYSNVWVMACVRAIAEDISSFPFRAGKDPDDRKTYNTKAPLAMLLGPHPGVPAPGISPRLWWQWIITQFLLAGQFAAEIVGASARGRGAVQSLWPLPVSQLEPIPSRRPGVWWDGFRYGGWSAEQRDLTADQVFYYWHPSQSDWRRAESVMQSARLDVSVAIMQDVYDYSFLRNDARPASVIVHERFAEVQMRDAFREKFLGEHTGPSNAGRPIFVENPEDSDVPPGESIKIIPIGLTQKDAEFIARYDRKLSAIRAAFGVPETRLGDTSGRTFTNAGQEYVVYFERLKTLADELAQAVNTWLAPRVGEELGWFDTAKLDNAVRESKLAAVGIVDALKARLIKINEGRAELGLEAEPDGDRFLTDEELALISGGAAQLLVAGGIPYSNAPSDYVPPGQAPPGADGNASPSPNGAPPSTTGGGDALAQLTAATDALPAARASSDITYDREAERTERRLRAYRRHERRVLEFEETYRRRFQRLLDRQLASAISRLEGKRGRQMLRDVRAGTGRVTSEDVFAPSYWHDETVQELRSLYEDIFASATQSVFDALPEEDVDAHLMTSHGELAQRFIDHRVNQMAADVTDTTYKGVRAALVEGTSLGESVPDLAKRIEGLFKQTYASRALTVARTEVLSAFNGSAYAAGTALPGDVVAGMEWLATPGPRTRPAHASANGQVVPKGQPFHVGGHDMKYPGDPAGPASQTVNCRCSLLVLTPEEYADRVPQVASPAPIPVTPRARGREAMRLAELEDVLVARVMPPMPEDGREQLITLEVYRARLSTDVA